LKEGWISGSDFSKFGQDEPMLDLPTVSRAEISKGKAMAYSEFYRDPACFIRTVRYINFMSMTNLLRLVKQAVRFTSLQKG
jgi:hypothetical protein